MRQGSMTSSERRVLMLFAAVIFAAAFFVVPVITHAQYDPNNTDPSYRAYWREYVKNRADISALGAVASPSLPIPVLLGKEVSQLESNFGDPRAFGARMHEGLDIPVPAGTPVVSPTDAVVLDRGNEENAGIFVGTVNPGDEHFIYMHLREIARGIEVGVTIKRGDVIGYVGKTGNASSTGPHLHFEIRHNGATDPFPRLTQVFTLEERMKSVQQALDRTTSSDMSQILASNFRETFLEAKAKGIAIPESVRAMLENGAQAVVPTAYAAAPAQAQALMPVRGPFTRDLESGMKGEDVRALQKYLNANGYLITSIGDGAPGYETTFFGAYTRKALITFQSAKGITPAAGYFGPKTRAYVQSH